VLILNDPAAWVRRQYPPSPLLSRAWAGGGAEGGRLLELLEGGELAGVLTELLDEAARVGAGVGGGGSTVGSTIHAYPLMEGVAAPAPRDWSARDCQLEEAAAVLDDAEDELDMERQV